MARSERQVSNDESSQLEASVTFPHPPQLSALADLLRVITEISPTYKLLWVSNRCSLLNCNHLLIMVAQENCWFFSSVIQEYMTEKCGGLLQYGGLAHLENAVVERRRIFEEMDKLR